MKKKLFFLILLIGFFTLASCDLSSPSSSDGTSTEEKTNANTKTVSFDTDGGSYISNQKVETGKTASKPSNPTKAGHTFIGWCSDSSLKTEYNFSDAVTTDITIYAKWKAETYTVKFYTDSNTTIEPLTVEYGNKVTKPTDPTKEGYTFDGWYTSYLYYFEYDFNSTIKGDLNLYAKWKEIPKTVKYTVGTPITKLWTDSINSKWIKVAVPVTNTGTADLYLGSSTIDIESSTGSLLKTISYVGAYPDYLKPGETGYYYEETTCNFSNTDIKAVANLEIEKSVVEMVRYEISDVTISKGTFDQIEVMGRIKNNTTSKGTLVTVVANLFDANGKLICTCHKLLENDLAVGAKVGFTLSTYSYSKFAPEDVASYEIYGYPLQYNF